MEVVEEEVVVEQEDFTLARAGQLIGKLIAIDMEGGGKSLP